MSWVKFEILDASNSTQRYANALAGIPGALEKAQHNAMQRAGDKGRTHAGRFASARYELSKAGFDRYTKTTVTGGGSATMSIKFAGGVIPLKQFTVRTSAAGLYAKAKDGGAVIPRAFISWKIGDHVFRRVGKPRLPIEKLFGPATPQMMNDEEVKSQMDQTITETYEERMEHEVERILNGW